MKYIMLFATFILSISANAQNCNEAMLLQKPGTWREYSSGVSGIAAADLAREKKVVAAIHTIVRNNL